MIPHFLGAVGGAPIEAVQLVRDDAVEIVAGASNAPALLWCCIAAGVVVVMGLVMAARRYLPREGNDAPTRAFLHVCRRLKLNRSDRQLIASLASVAPSQSVHPVAVLLSQETFVRCVGLAVDARVEWAKPEAIVAVHRKVFPGASV